MKHGDGVKDIAFAVQDCDFLVQVNNRPTALYALHTNVFAHIMPLLLSFLCRKPESEVQLS